VHLQRFLVEQLRRRIMFEEFRRVGLVPTIKEEDLSKLPRI